MKWIAQYTTDKNSWKWRWDIDTDFFICLSVVYCMIRFTIFELYLVWRYSNSKSALWSWCVWVIHIWSRNSGDGLLANYGFDRQAWLFGIRKVWRVSAYKARRMLNSRTFFSRWNVTRRNDSTVSIMLKCVSNSVCVCVLDMRVLQHFDKNKLSLFPHSHLRHASAVLSHFMRILKSGV